MKVSNANACAGARRQPLASRVQDQIMAVKIRQNLPRPRRVLMDQISSSDQRMSASALHKLQAPREDWVRSAQIVRLKVAAFLLGMAPVSTRGYNERIKIDRTF
jgi:hypothetical protein